MSASAERISLKSMCSRWADFRQSLSGNSSRPCVARIQILSMTDLHSRTRHWAKSWKELYKYGEHYLSDAVHTGTENKITNIPRHNLRSIGGVCVAILDFQPGSWHYLAFFIIHKGPWTRGGGIRSSFLFLQATCLPECKLFWSGSECPWHR